ncbi:hypothetical protein GCM10010353_60930 [Streptomyces chryseus]|nr:hypothetical protein GCM10010353_60930 [Streptomyces chryseus]
MWSLVVVVVAVVVLVVLLAVLGDVVIVGEMRVFSTVFPRGSVSD